MRMGRGARGIAGAIVISASFMVVAGTQPASAIQNAGYDGRPDCRARRLEREGRFADADNCRQRRQDWRNSMRYAPNEEPYGGNSRRYTSATVNAALTYSNPRTKTSHSTAHQTKIKTAASSA